MEKDNSVTVIIETKEDVVEGEQREIFFYLPVSFLKRYDRIKENRPSVLDEYLDRTWGTGTDAHYGAEPLKYRRKWAKTEEREQELIDRFIREVREAMKNRKAREIRKKYCKTITVSVNDE